MGSFINNHLGDGRMDRAPYYENGGEVN